MLCGEGSPKLAKISANSLTVLRHGCLPVKAVHSRNCSVFQSPKFDLHYFQSCKSVDIWFATLQSLYIDHRLGLKLSVCSFGLGEHRQAAEMQ